MALVFGEPLVSHAFLLFQLGLQIPYFDFQYFDYVQLGGFLKTPASLALFYERHWYERLGIGS